MSHHLDWMGNTLQLTATHCNIHCNTHCNTNKARGSSFRLDGQHTLQLIATHCNSLHHTALHCITLQLTASHCNSLHHTATHCNTLQLTASHCNSLHHTVGKRGSRVIITIDKSDRPKNALFERTLSGKSERTKKQSQHVEGDPSFERTTSADRKHRRKHSLADDHVITVALVRENLPNLGVVLFSL